MIICGVAATLITGLTGVANNLSEYTMYSLSELIFLVPTLILLIIDRFDVLRGIRLKFIGIRTILWTILFTILVLPVMGLLNILSQFLVSNVATASLVETATMPWWINLIYIAVLPGIVEEFLFRGVLFHAMRPCSLFKSAVITGILFGLMHLNFNQFLYATALGILFAYLVEASGSLFSSMLSHTLINTLPVLLMQVANRLYPEDLVRAAAQMHQDAAGDAPASVVELVIMAAIAIVGLILAAIVLKQIAKTNGREKLYSDALRGKDRIKGKEGRVFSIELVIGALIAIVMIGTLMILGMR